MGSPFLFIPGHLHHERRSSSAALFRRNGPRCRVVRPWHVCHTRPVGHRRVDTGPAGPRGSGPTRVAVTLVCVCVWVGGWGDWRVDWACVVPEDGQGRILGFQVVRSPIEGVIQTYWMDEVMAPR